MMVVELELIYYLKQDNNDKQQKGKAFGLKNSTALWR